ncbi:MAG: ribosomal-protein-alanine N-acetyltransferase [Gemmatimonadetes bacterium]|nr:ribosomal-protein-alanine N-acetyltransferase [Gemmatimonadota bacterium]
MDVPFRVRRAAEVDLQDILEIEGVSFSDPWPQSFFVNLFNDTSWVVEFRGHVIAYLFGRVAADEAEVLNLAVHADHRRRGVAGSILEAALAGFYAVGGRIVYLEVRAANEEAQAFYRKFGFEEQGRRARYYDRPPEDAVIMTRRIGPQKGPK